jgi:hypothetical protein
MCVARILVSEIMTTEIGRFRDLIIAGHMSRETLRKHQSAMIKAFFNVYASAFTVFDTTNKSPQMIVRQMSDIYEVLKNFNDMLDTRVWYETEEVDKLNEKRKLHNDIVGNDRLLGEIDKIISLVLKNKTLLDQTDKDLNQKIIWTCREIRKNKAKYLEFHSPEDVHLEI